MCIHIIQLDSFIVNIISITSDPLDKKATRPNIKLSETTHSTFISLYKTFAKINLSNTKSYQRKQLYSNH